MTTATFVLSTGRCGTQWLARCIERSHGFSAVITHEPLHIAYEPRLMLGAKEPSRLPDDEYREPILEHAAWIGEILRDTNYIECGHPNWSSIPYLIDRFRPDVRVIHLVRHPVPTSWSWLTHQAFLPPPFPHLAEKVLLSPFDEGIQFLEYRDRWKLMVPYEKALYYWAEVNAFALVLERNTDVPWMRVTFEDLFQRETIERIVTFAGLDPARSVASSNDHVDEYQFRIVSWSDSRLILEHPAVMEVATKLGYDPLDFDEESLRARYLGIRI